MRLLEELFEGFEHVNIQESNSLNVRGDISTKCNVPVAILIEIVKIYPYTVSVEDPGVKLRLRRIPQRQFLKTKGELNRLVRIFEASAL